MDVPLVSARPRERCRLPSGANLDVGEDDSGFCTERVEKIVSDGQVHTRLRKRAEVACETHSHARARNATLIACEAGEWGQNMAWGHILLQPTERVLTLSH
eukprot:scaffold5177_cov130-Isochrysis_galbana.AAC.2